MNYNGIPNLPEGYELLPKSPDSRIWDNCYYCCSGDDEWTKCDNWIWPKENLIYCRPIQADEAAKLQELIRRARILEDIEL